LLAARLTAERAKDRARGATSSGPHTDDLDMTFDGRDAGAFASQGQLRALVLALKIAEIEILAATLGDAPVLLLDDVSSELDEKRNEQLFEFLGTMAGQTFITTTHPRHVLIPENSSLRADFRVAEGGLVL
jgi:DNA replication and repair protein RecF